MTKFYRSFGKSGKDCLIITPSGFDSGQYRGDVLLYRGSDGLLVKLNKSEIGHVKKIFGARKELGSVDTDSFWARSEVQNINSSLNYHKGYVFAAFRRAARKHLTRRKEIPSITQETAKILQTLRALSEKPRFDGRGNAKPITVLDIAKATNFGPARFASTLSDMSRKHLIKLRGQTCKILLKESGMITKRNRHNPNIASAWLERLNKLEAQENAYRSRNPRSLKVATAPVGLSISGQQMAPV